MNREKLYILQDGEGSTFEKDNDLPKLPLPKLEDTLNRYFETLKPFGSPEELKNSRKIIDEFRSGIGGRLHAQLEEKASNLKNWVEKWWEDYGYHTLRVPLYPYTVMVMPLLLESVNVPESKEYSLKAAARCMHFTLEFWDLIRQEKIRPATSGNGSVYYSSVLYKRFCSTSRLPGPVMDKVVTHFKTISEGVGPSHIIVMGKGRIFKMQGLNLDGSLLSPQQILPALQYIRAVIDNEYLGDCVPTLTCDERTSWANNRVHLQELSGNNAEILKDVESSALMLYFDENEPKNYSESCALGLTGDFHSKWADRSSVLVIYKNGKIACLGEHSSYDGTISISYGFFVLLSFFEIPEPDWSVLPEKILLPVELKFDLDEKLKGEIQRVLEDCESRRNEVIVIHHTFDNFAKEFMKSHKMHPDAFIQVILQLTYYKMHNELASTYETALMRQYYNGRTETLRSCTLDCVDFLKKATNPKSSKRTVLESFRKAVNTHNFMMSEARKGHGIDRHLFGLWCLAYEQNLEVPELYSDPLYMKSGGGGNFVLSTSTLGYTVNTGFVAPMVLDGYGCFYSITPDVIYLQVTSFRASTKTSAHKFARVFDETLLEIKNILEGNIEGKL